MRCWDRRIKVICWLESSVSARILSNVYLYTNVDLVGMHFICGAAKVNGSNDCVTIVCRLLPLQVFCDIFQYPIMSRSIKRSIPVQHLIKTLKSSAIWQIPTHRSFHVNSMSSRSISLYSLIHELHVVKLHIDVTTHAARNLFGGWPFKPAKCFNLQYSTASTTTSALHFITHIHIQNLLT